MTPESIVDSNQTLPSWVVKAKYVVLGVIILLILCLFIYMYKTLNSYSRHLQNLTNVVAEHEERLNKQSKLYSLQHIVTEQEKLNTNTHASLNTIMNENIYNKLPDVFQIQTDTKDVQEEIFIEKQPEPEPEPCIDFETELAEEIQELIESKAGIEEEEEGN